MKKYIVISSLLLLFTSCSPTPETLAHDACDCFAKAKAEKNTDNQLNDIDECNSVYQNKFMTLKEIEQDKGMNPEQVKAFEDRFYNIYNDCK